MSLTLKSVFKAVAPTLGKLIGGAIGGEGGSKVGQAIGTAVQSRILVKTAQSALPKTFMPNAGTLTGFGGGTFSGGGGGSSFGAPIQGPITVNRNGQLCYRKRRRMNYCNGRALVRAGRRMKGALKMFHKIERRLPHAPCHCKTKRAFGKK